MKLIEEQPKITHLEIVYPDTIKMTFQQDNPHSKKLDETPITMTFSFRSHEIYQGLKLRELIERWLHNLEVLNAGLQGNHKFANRIIPSLYRLLEDSKK